VESRSDNSLRWIVVALLWVLLLILTDVARAQSLNDSDPPDLMNLAAPRDMPPGMMAPLIATDASPGNTVTPFAPQWIRTPEGRVLGFGFGLDKMLSQNADLEVDSAFDSVSPREGSGKTGFADVDITGRYLFINQPDLMFAVAPQMTIATGGFGEGAGIGNAGLAFAWAGRGGILPEDWDLGYFRAIEVRSDLGYSRILSNGSGNEVFIDPVIDYSFPYLQYLTRKELPWGIRNLCVFTEFNFDEVLSGTDHSPPAFYVTPGVSYLTDAYQVSLGVQVPVNHAADHSQQLAMLGEVQFNLDDVPVLGWMPL